VRDWAGGREGRRGQDRTGQGGVAVRTQAQKTEPRRGRRRRGIVVQHLRYDDREHDRGHETRENTDSDRLCTGGRRIKYRLGQGSRGHNRWSREHDTHTQGYEAQHRYSGKSHGVGTDEGMERMQRTARERWHGVVESERRATMRRERCRCQQKEIAAGGRASMQAACKGWEARRVSAQTMGEMGMVCECEDTGHKGS